MMVFFLVAACNGEKDITTVFPSITPEPSFTPTFTPTKIRPTRTFPPPPTRTPFPDYQTRQVIFNYYVVGNHADYNLFFAPESCCSITRMVLYNDGQLLIADKANTYKQKVLSPAEIKEFLSKLETLGFYSLESNQQHDPTDKLYDFGNNYQESFDALRDCIFVDADRSRNLCVYEPNLQFLIPKMKNIIKYLDEYEPAGMTPYYPDRIFLSIETIDPATENLPATAIPWDEHFREMPSATVYLDGEMAKEIFMLFASKENGIVFSQNGNEYMVYIRVILPHEKLTNAN
jgi:hypothetical protein